MALRPEARPAIYKVLDRQQKDAFGRIVKLIAEAIADIDAARGSRSADTIGPPTQLPPWLDARSATRTAFLHGHRGMGKTTVMLSVLRACLHWDDTEYPTDLATDLVRAMRTMRARTVWLEPIALEPLPSSVNLLAALLARIDRAVQKRISPTGEGAGDPTARGHGGAFALVSDQERALLQLQRLQTNVAVAWGGNLPVRGGQLDPDTYAVELLRAERSRLSIKSELTASLDALADAFYPAAAPVTNPLFILPVDDVDLDPLRCLEILKLLRLVPVPRLFAIVLGNLRLVDLVLNLQYSNEFASAYQGRFLETLSVDSNAVAGWAGQAAANAAAKLIPLAQRIALEHMSIQESLNFKPFAPDARQLIPFHELLAQLPVTFEAWGNTTNAPKNLREFLLCTNVSKKKVKKEVEEQDVANSHYSAKNILHAPPRRIADWWLDLQRVLDLLDRINKNAAASKKQKTTEIHGEMVFAMGRICYWAISEDHMLPTRKRSTYRQALRINPAGIWELVKAVDAIPDIDRSHNLSRLRFPDAPNEPWAGLHSASRILINRGKGWIWRPGKGGRFIPPTIHAQEPDYSTVFRFNDDSTYALMLLHDLLALGPDWEVMMQSVRINRPVERWAATVWRGGSESRAWIPWPAPCPPSYWEIDLFVHYWNKVVREYDEPLPDRSVEGTLQPLVYGWINAGQAVWHHQPPEPCGAGRQTPTRSLNGRSWPRR